MPLHTRILLGLVIGAVLGILANAALGPEHGTVAVINTYVAGPLGQIFLRLMFMVVMPLIFASIVLGVAGIGDLRHVGRLGAKTLGFFVCSTFAASALGLVAVLLVAPGASLDPAVRDGLMETYGGAAASSVAASQSAGFSIDTLVSLFTRNPIRSAADGDMLGVIVFALLFGAALTLITRERALPLIGVLEALNDVMVKIVQMAMRLAPYGVAALIFGVTSRFGTSLLKPLGLFVALVLGTLILHGAVLLLVVIRGMCGVRPGQYLRRIRASLVTAFSTSSSSATLPTNLTVATERVGVPARIAGFVLPLGSTMCMNGTSLFEGITVLFLAEVFGVQLTVGQMAIVLVMTVVTAIGAAGVPGGSIPLLVGVLAMMGIPAEGIAIVLGVDRILDMSRTTVNVLGDMICATWVAKIEGVWSPATMRALAVEPVSLDDSPGWPAEEEVPPRR
jgi:DAACS family dicarboxylate/amino acid:cation (Na+ or H+) symporter